MTPLVPEHTPTCIHCHGEMFIPEGGDSLECAWCDAALSAISESPAVKPCAKCGRDVDHFIHGDHPSDFARAKAILVLNHEFVESLPAKVRILSPAPVVPEGAPELRAPTIEEIVQTLREVEWSVAFDCLHHETLTPHGRKVLGAAAGVVAALASEEAVLVSEGRLRNLLEDVDRGVYELGVSLSEHRAILAAALAGVTLQVQHAESLREIERLRQFIKDTPAAVLT